MSRDTEDDDLGELRRLRQSQQFQKHLSTWGDRNAVKHAAAAAEQEEADRLERLQQQQADAAAAKDDDDDGFKPPSAFAASASSSSSSSGSGAGPAKPASASATASSSGDSAAASASKPGPKQQTRRGKIPAFRDEDGTEVQYVDAQPADGDPMRSFFPMGFGANKKKGAAQQMAAAVDATSLRAKMQAASASKAAAAAAAAAPKPDALPAPAAASSSSASAAASSSGKDEKQPRPTGAAAAAAAGAADDEDAVGPPRPPGAAAAAASDAAADDEDLALEELLETAKRLKLPITHEVEMGGHDKTVSALAVDPAGGRVLTGSYDYTVKFYDFAGMNESMQSFRSIEPEEGHQIRHLQWSPTGDTFLVATGSARPKLYNRDGFELAQFVRGDMYIVDAKQTKGHLTGVSGAAWHPHDKTQVLTSSLDGTLRIWDVSTVTTGNKEVIKYKSVIGGRKSECTACAWAPGAQVIAGAGTDGGLMLWNAKTKFSRPSHVVPKAHEPNAETSGLTFSADGHTLCSRSTDNTLKLWDVRKFTAPVHVFDDMENFYAQTNVAFSPDGSLIITGTSNKSEAAGSKGQLVFIDRAAGEVVQSVGVSTRSLVRVAWHDKINQIFVGCSDAKTRVLYSPEYSKKGALLSVGRRAAKKTASDFVATSANVIAPHALPMFKAAPSKRKQMEKDARDPTKSKLPQKPLAGVAGQHGRVSDQSVQHFMMKQIIAKKPRREEDPREALLRYADKAAADPMFTGNAYAKTQPKPILDYAGQEEEARKDQTAKQLDTANRRMA